MLVFSSFIFCWMYSWQSTLPCSVVHLFTQVHPLLYGFFHLIRFNLSIIGVIFFVTRIFTRLCVFKLPLTYSSSTLECQILLCWSIWSIWSWVLGKAWDKKLASFCMLIHRFLKAICEDAVLSPMYVFGISVKNQVNVIKVYFFILKILFLSPSLWAIRLA